jgi:hypothetical protein
MSAKREWERALPRTFAIFVLIALGLVLVFGVSSGGAGDVQPCEDPAACSAGDEDQPGEDVGDAGDEESPPPAITQGQAPAPSPQPQPAAPETPVPAPEPQAPVSEAQPQPAPQPQPATPATPTPVATGPQAPVPQPAAPETPAPAKPAPQAPKAATTGPAVPAGPPGGDLLIREFHCEWTGGPARCWIYASHSSGCKLRLPDGKVLDVRLPPGSSDNSEGFWYPVPDFPTKGGEAVLTCWGSPPDRGGSPGSKTYNLGPAPTSTQKVTVVVKAKAKKHGRTVKANKPKTIAFVKPTPPDGVPGWCYTDSKGVWGFIQAPVTGSTRSLYTPGYGPHCDPNRVIAEPNGKAMWQWYINTFYHGKDPRKK